jgi:glyoxylase-like metal-dependent hydrolase (beta-lactamase superfamily II)
VGPWPRLAAVAATFSVAEGITAVDTVMCGQERVTSSYLLEGSEPAIVETGPTTSLRALTEGLESLGIGPSDLAHVVVTHIHLDHAGGAGAVAERFPAATVWVHERGAPHLAEPAKLVASASRIYGAERLRNLFGAVYPVPSERLRAVTDDDTISLGDRRLHVLHTPGHAGHHVCLIDSRTGGVFVGDAFGVFLPDVRVLRPATPPPEFDLELAIGSIERVTAADPSVLLFSHFGPAGDVRMLSDLAVARLREWTAIVEEALGTTDRVEDVVAALERRTEPELHRTTPPAGGRERYELLSSYEMNAQGIMRYLRKLAEDRSADPD